MDPEELLQRAEASAGNPGATQAEIRRAISDAYYALFHLCQAAAADMVQGPLALSSDEYGLVYRSVDHFRLRAVRSQLNSKPSSDTEARFGRMIDFVNIANTLQEHRHFADYEPPAKTYTAEQANIYISNARQAISWFWESTAEQRRAFLLLLLFKSR